MRLKYTRMTAAIAAAIIGIAVLAGCSSNPTEADDKSDAYTCSQADAASIKAAEKDKKDADKALAKAAPFNKGDAEAALTAATAKVEALNTRATECEKGSAATATDGTCEAKFTQVTLTHEGNQVDDQNRAKYEAAVANVTNLSDAQRDFFVAETGTSAWKLAIWSHSIGLHADPNDWTSLVTEDQTCLNEAGKELWYSTKGAISAKGVTFEEAPAPENGWNSGVHETTYGTSPEQGVRGDRTAIKITFPDGTVAYILIRCGNPVFPGKPSLPDVPTDNPPVPEGPDAKNNNDLPQRNNNVPTQQMPNVLPAQPGHAQPVEPPAPPAVAPAPPAPPAPTVAPVGPVPAPKPEPSPIVTTPVEAPPGPPPATCSPAPGRTCP